MGRNFLISLIASRENWYILLPKWGAAAVAGSGWGWFWAVDLSKFALKAVPVPARSLERVCCGPGAGRSWVQQAGLVGRKEKKTNIEL